MRDTLQPLTLTEVAGRFLELYILLHQHRDV